MKGVRIHSYSGPEVLIWEGPPRFPRPCEVHIRAHTPVVARSTLKRFEEIERILELKGLNGGYFFLVA